MSFYILIITLTGTSKPLLEWCEDKGSGRNHRPRIIPHAKKAPGKGTSQGSNPTKTESQGSTSLCNILHLKIS